MDTGDALLSYPRMSGRKGKQTHVDRCRGPLTKVTIKIPTPLRSRLLRLPPIVRRVRRGVWFRACPAARRFCPTDHAKPNIKISKRCPFARPAAGPPLCQVRGVGRPGAVRVGAVRPEKVDQEMPALGEAVQLAPTFTHQLAASL